MAILNLISHVYLISIA